MSPLPVAVRSSKSRRQHLSSFEIECVNLFASGLREFGLPPTVGQIYGLLYAARAPLSFGDIVTSLRISKGSVSQGLAVLRECGAARSVKVEGRRNDHFVPELSLRRLGGGLIENRLSPLVEVSRQSVKRISGRGVKDAHEQARLEQLQVWSSELARALPMLRLLLAPPSP